MLQLLAIIRVFGLLALCCLCFYGYGMLVMRWLDFKKEQIPGQWIYALALGFGVTGHLVFLAGIVGWLYPSVAWAVVFTGALVAIFELVIHFEIYEDAFRSNDLVKKMHTLTWFEASLVVLILLALIYPLLANAFVPPTGWDEAAYHLAVPKIYIQSHSFIYIPYIPHSNWPMETEALSALSLLLGSEKLAQALSWLELVLICASLVVYCRKYFNRTTGLLAAAIFSSTPMVASLAGTTMVELPMSFFGLLAIIAWLEWADQRDRRYLLLSAVLGGITACVKLNAATIPITLGVGIFLVNRFYHKDTWRHSIVKFTTYGLVALAIVLPWYVKAWVQTGNPFWPFLYNLLGGQNWDQLGTDLFEGFIRQPNMPMNLLNWLTGLWQLTWEPLRFGSVFLGWLYLALIPFGLAGIFLMPDRDLRRRLTWIGLLALIGYTSWFLLTHQARFLMPTLSVLALFLGAGFTWLRLTRSRRLAAIVQIGILCLLVCFNWIVVKDHRNRVLFNYPFLMGQVSRNQYLKERIQGYPAFLYVNRDLPEDAVVWLSLWESRGYYLDRQYIWANPVNQRILKLEQIQDAGQLKQALRSHGVTHILYSTVLVDRLAYLPYSAAINSVIQQLLEKDCRLLYQTNTAAVYELLP